MRKTVLITGSSSGIGKETAMLFQKKGWNVSATMRNPDEQMNIMENMISLKLDVTDPASIKTAVIRTIAKFGSIDAVVNNAGYSLVGAFELATKEQIDRQFAVNLFGIMNVLREVIPIFREKKKGIIINNSSVGGKITVPLLSFYQGTKWAVHGFSESLQYELKQFNIKMKIIEPGFVLTDIMKSMDLAKKENIKDYDSYSNGIIKSMIKIMAKGKPPINTAKVIYKAATDNTWKMHYSSGIDAKLLILFRWILPTSIFNKILRKVVR